MNKLEEIYYDYSIKGEILDQDGIIEIIKYLITSNKLERYLNRVMFHKVSDTYSDQLYNCACMDQNERILHIYIKDIMSALQLETNRYRHLFKKEELIFFSNACLIQNLLHEIEHVIQNKEMEEKDSLEAKIARWSSLIVYKDVTPEELEKKKQEIMKALAEKQALYNANYKYCPLERWAELNSFGKIITINGHLDNIQGINDVFRLLTTYQELKGYKTEDGRIYSPTLRYLINTGNEPELYTLDWYKGNNIETDINCMKKFNYDDRLYYGFPIQPREIQVKVLEFKYDQKRLIKN